MKKDWSKLDRWRQAEPPSSPGARYGAFVIPCLGVHLRVIATDGEGEGGEGWEHVSCHVWDPVFRRQRVPNWYEMCHLKELFWEEEETVVQFHPKKSDYVNCHPFVLHLWRPQGEMALPPRVCV